jgi:hypothetical protein
MVYSYWLGALIVIPSLILGLPFLSRDRIYRIATLFAGMNVGIITFHFFIYALRRDIGSRYLNELHIVFTTTIPVFYIASLIIGSTLIPKYYLESSTRLAGVFATLGVLLALYLTYIATGLLIWILSFMINQGVPSSALLLETTKNLAVELRQPDFSLVNDFLGSAFITLYGLDPAMRIFGGSGSLKNEEME